MIEITLPFDNLAQAIKLELGLALFISKEGLSYVAQIGVDHARVSGSKGNFIAILKNGFIFEEFGEFEIKKKFKHKD